MRVGDVQDSTCPDPRPTQRVAARPSLVVASVLVWVALVLFVVDLLLPRAVVPLPVLDPDVVPAAGIAFACVGLVGVLLTARAGYLRLARAARAPAVR